jgi:enoyl-CoA hydratase/carnithine racemase
MFDTIEVTAEGTRGTVVLNRPDKLNPLGPDTLRELAAAAQWFDRERPDVRVVVVSGRGRVFSAGADIGAFADPNGVRHADADAGRLMAEALERMSAVTVARIHGWCVGGAVVLAAACDLRVAADDARFSIPEVDIGIPLAWGGIPRLVREIGPAATKDLVMTCREFGADEALALGLLTRVVAPGALDDAVEALAETVAGKPRAAVQATKRHVNAVTEGSSQAGRSWSDADSLIAAIADPESREHAARYLQQRGRRASGGGG